MTIRHYYYEMYGCTNPGNLHISIDFASYLMNTYESISNADDIQSYETTTDTLPWMFVGEELPMSMPCDVYVNAELQTGTFNIDVNGYMSFQGFTCAVGDTVDFKAITGIQLSHV